MFLFCALTELGDVCEAKRTRTVACELARARVRQWTYGGSFRVRIVAKTVYCPNLGLCAT